MSKNLLSSQQAKTIDPDEVTLVFPDNKQAKWRRDSDVVASTENPDDDPLYDKRVLLAVPRETIQDYKEIGVVEPVILFQYQGRIYCEDGVQRTKGLRLANAEIVSEGGIAKGLPYIFTTYEDALKIYRRRTSLNYHRTDDKPHQKAEHAARLLSQGAPEQKVATSMCTSIQSVRDYKRYMAAPSEVLKAVTQNELSYTTVLDWQKEKTPAEEQLRLAAELREATAGRTTLSGAPKKASGTEAKKAAKKQVSFEAADTSDHTKTIAKIYRLLDELTADERIPILAKYDADGEEKPIVSAQEIEGQNQSLELDEAESDVPELKVELDTDQPTEGAKPARKSKAKRAGKK